MSSKDKDVREAQKQYFLAKTEERILALKDKGLGDSETVKDSLIKQYRAKVKQIDRALKRISFLQDQNEKLRERKEQQKADREAARAAEISGELKKKEKKKVEEAPAPKGKKKAAGSGKAATQAKPQAKKK